MSAWSLDDSKLKRYPHFDPVISAEDAVAYVTDPKRIVAHKFYPLMLSTQRWNRFSKKGELGQEKTRPIRYSARLDAYIYSYYRSILSDSYEAELSHRGLSENIIAYRRLQCKSTGDGMCNIHFARDAFDKIRIMGNCSVITMDIASFFDSLDHNYLKKMWCKIIGQPSLPRDHLQVFKQLTNYAYVDKISVYTRLGFFGPKRTGALSKSIEGYLIPFKKFPKQLCCGTEFRNKIAGGDGRKTIIKKNRKPYGIPQGTPISDLLANIYMVEFDQWAKDIANDVGGVYYRYSDDILFILPVDRTVGLDYLDRVRTRICLYGSKLKIKDKKTSLTCYSVGASGQNFELVAGSQGKNGVEYLGFRYDGQKIYIRDSTLSNLRRRVVLAARRDAVKFVKRYSDKDLPILKTLFNYERLIKRFGKVEDFFINEGDYQTWTFWSYSVRSAACFGVLGRSILRQLRALRTLIIRRVHQELERAVRKFGVAHI